MNRLIPSSRPQSAFTLIELLVVIAIIAILAAILFPVFATAREKARQTSCLSNEKQMGTAFAMYAQDYDETYPLWNVAAWVTDGPGGCNPNFNGAWNETSGDLWDAKLYPYVKMGHADVVLPKDRDYSGVWHCPDSELDNNYRTYGVSYGYAFNIAGRSDDYCIREGNGLQVAEIASASQFIMAGESGGDPNTTFPDGPNSNDGNGGLMNRAGNFEGYAVYYKLAFGSSIDRERPYRHNGGANYVFNDGHAKWLKAEIPYPHPAPPTPVASASNTDKGNAACATGTYHLPSAPERAYYQKRAVNVYGVSCNIQ